VIPFDLRTFINVMSVVIFGAVVVSCLFAFFAYGLAINRKKRAARATEPVSKPETQTVSRPPSEL